MVNDIESTVIQMQEKHKGWENGQKPSQPGTQHQEGAEFPVHDGCIMKGLADGNIAVVGHGSEKVKFSHPHENREK